MPKLTGPLFSVEARKSLAKALTYQRRPGGASVYGYKKPKVPLTYAQYIQRYKIRLYVKAWQALSDADKALWEAKAKGQGQSGYSYFIKQKVGIPIDVGSLATDRGSAVSPTVTIFDIANPANLSGLITSIDVWAATNITGFRVGVFFLVSGTTYQCRSSATIGNVTAGSKQTFPVSLPIQAGDFIGCYYATGGLENDLSGGTGQFYIIGEYIDPGDSASYTAIAVRAMSLYGEGIGEG